MKKYRLRVWQQEDKNQRLKIHSSEIKSTYKSPLNIKVTVFNLMLKIQDLYAVPEMKSQSLLASFLTHLVALNI